MRAEESRCTHMRWATSLVMVAAQIWSGLSGFTHSSFMPRSNSCSSQSWGMKTKHVRNTGGEEGAGVIPKSSAANQILSQTQTCALRSPGGWKHSMYTILGVGGGVGCSKRFSSKSDSLSFLLHLRKIWALTVTLTVKTAHQIFCMTPQTHSGVQSYQVWSQNVLQFSRYRSNLGGIWTFTVPDPADSITNA